jgi:hypothetical protein
MGFPVWIASALVAALALAGCSTSANVAQLSDTAGDPDGDGGPAASQSGTSPGTVSKTTTGTSSTKTTTGTTSGTTTTASTASTTSSTSVTSTEAPQPRTVLPAQHPSTRDWGQPAGRDIRPGLDTSQAGSACTANFVYHLNDTRYFIGLAAHCFQTGSNPVSESCPTDNSPLGTPVTLYGADGDRYDAHLAYNSYLTMQEVKEADAEACAGNDFALVEVAAKDFGAIHPAVRYYGGPTRVLDAGELKAGDNVHGYGNSDLRSGYELVPTPQTNPHDGEFLGYDYGGWEVVTRFVPPTIQGDSGSGLLGPGGEATGVLSSGSITYTEEQYTNIAFALRYMHARLGWSPSVVTWAEFDAAGIEDP